MSSGGWALGGVGMGIVFPMIPLSVMSEATEGREPAELSLDHPDDYLGVGVGAGLGGVCIALADAGTISLEAGASTRPGDSVSTDSPRWKVGRRERIEREEASVVQCGAPL